MNSNKGHFVISLDFELSWGVFDARSVDSYKSNLLNVRVVIPKLLELCDKYNINISFATVGLLFAKSKDEILNLIPNNKPSYTNNNFNPYHKLDALGEFEVQIHLHTDVDAVLKLVIAADQD